LDWGPVPLFAPWKHCSQCDLLYDSSFFWTFLLWQTGVSRVHNQR